MKKLFLLGKSVFFDPRRQLKEHDEFAGVKFPCLPPRGKVAPQGRMRGGCAGVALDLPDSMEKGTTLTAVPAYTFDGATPESAALPIQL